MEAVIAVVIKIRLTSIMHMQHWDRLEPMKVTINGQEHSCAPTPLVSSLMAILESTKNEVEVAPFEKLCRLYSQIFSRTVASVIGKELDQDMQALFKLRNLFAHSRDWYLELDSLDEGHRVHLDGNPLQLPAQRLQKAGIIDRLDFTGKNHPKLMEHLYSDGAMLFFYDQVKNADMCIRASVDHLPEKSMVYLSDLPDLRTK